MKKFVIVTSAKTEDLKADTRASIVQLCITAYQEEDFNNLFNYVTSGGWHFLLYRDKQLVSHALVTTRRLQPAGGAILKTAYVDAVATLPSYQGQGYGSMLMRQVASEIESVYDIACLETEQPAFYERLGWELWRGPLSGRSEEGLIPTPEQNGVMIFRLTRTPSLDLNQGLSVECQPGRIW